MADRSQLRQDAFETRLERALRDEVRDAVRPVDALEIATVAMSGPLPPGRWPVMLRAAVVVALLVALLAGAALIAGTRLVQQADPEVPLSVDGSLVYQWIGDAHSGPGRAAASDQTRLSISPTSIEATSRVSGMDYPLLEAVAVTEGETLRITAEAGDDCTAGDEGEYRWSLASGGSVLTIEPGTDDCEVRAGILPGTWYRRNCPPGDVVGCLGDLVPGTYPSTNFATGLDALGDWHPKLGALTYTVPDGWTNSHDWSAGLWLEPTASHDRVLAAKGGVDDAMRDTGTGIYVLARPVAALQNGACVTGMVDRSVGETVDDLVDYVVHHPAVVPSSDGVRSIEVGPLQGRMVDVTLSPTWRKTCPEDDTPLALLLTVKGGSQATGFGDEGISAGSVDRFILLDLGGGRPVLVNIMAPSRAAFDGLLPEAMEIVQSFRFPHD